MTANSISSRITPRTLAVAAVVVLAVLAAGLAATLLVPPGTTPVGLTTSAGDSMGASGQQIVLYADLQPSVGNVVIFDAGADHGLVRHRIVAATAEGFVTKGDANAMVDQHALSAELDGMPHATSERIRGVSLVAVPVSLIEGVGAGLLGFVLLVGLWAGRREIASVGKLVSERVVVEKGLSTALALFVVLSVLSGIPFGGNMSPVQNTSADVEGATFVDSVSAQDSNHEGVTFNSDGTKMYTVGSGGDSVYQYSLSTAFDVSTASFTKSFDVSSEDGQPKGVEFNDDGSKMFVVGTGNSNIYSYTLSTAYDIGTASYSGNTLSTGGFPEGIVFNSDGTKVYAAMSSSDSIQAWDLSTAYDLTTASSGNSMATQAALPTDMSFSGDGTKLLVSDGDTATIYEHDLSTGFDLSTASYSSNSLDVSGQDGSPNGIKLNDDGSKMYIAGNSNNKVYEYDIDLSGFSNTPDLVTRVTDQHGDPISNATVKVYGFNKSAFSYSGQDELDREIANLTNLIENPTPLEWENQTNRTFEPTSTTKKNPFHEQFGEDVTVALAHERSAYGTLGRVAKTGEGDFGTDKPRLRDQHTLSPTSSEDLVITLWDYSKWSGFSAVTQDEIDEDAPGATTTGNVTIERVDAAGEPIDKFTASTSFFVTTGVEVSPVNVGKKTHEAVVLRDPDPGFYRIYPEGHPDRAIVYAVSPDGEASKLRKSVTEALKRENETLTERAQQIQDAIDNNKISAFNLSTNATGYATRDSLPSNIESVHVQSYKAPDGMTVNDPQNVTQADIESFVNDEIDAYEQDLEDLDSTAGLLDEQSGVADLCRVATTEPDSGALTDRVGKGYAPSDPKQVEIPSSQTVQLQMHSTEASEYADLENGQCYGFRLAHYLQTNNFTDTLSWLQQHAGDLSRDELEDVYSIAIDAAKGSPVMCNRLAHRTGVDPGGECDGGFSDDNGDGYVGDVSGGGTAPDGTTIPTDPDTIEDTSRDTLENTTDDAQAVIGVISGSDGIEECRRSVEDEDGQKAINIVWCSERDIGDATIHIRLDWSNGTTDYLTPNSSYVEIFDTSNPADEDEIQLLAYPMGSNDPPSVSATAVVVGSDGGGIGGSLPGGGDDGGGGDGGDGSDSSSGGSDEVITAPSDGPIRNPTFSGTIPALDAVRVSTLRPGPDERVQVGVRPSDEATYGTLEAVTVTGPSGSSLNVSNVSNGRNVAFTTNGTGQHHIELVYSNANGTQFTEVIRLGAGPVGHDLPPTIQAKEGPTGTYAIVAAYESGQIDVKEGGSRIEAVGVLGANAEIPATTSIHTVGLSRPNDATARFRLVRAPDQQAVSRSITTRWHMNPMTADSVLYRHGDSKNAVPLDGGNQYATVDRNGTLTIVTTYTTGDGDVAIRSVTTPGRWASLNHWVDLQLQGVPIIGGFVTAPAPVAGLMASLPFVGLALVFSRRWSL